MFAIIIVLLKLNKTFITFIFIYLSYINVINCVIYKNDNKIIICLASDDINIRNTINKEYNNILNLPYEIQILEKYGYIELDFIKENTTNLNRILTILYKNRNNSILFINNKCTFPDG